MFLARRGWSVTEGASAPFFQLGIRDQMIIILIFFVALLIAIGLRNYFASFGPLGRMGWHWVSPGGKQAPPIWTVFRQWQPGELVAIRSRFDP